MSATQPHPTPPQDRIPAGQMIAYGAGAIANNLLGSAIGYMSIVLNVGLGMNPALVGTLQAIPRFWDALIDPVMGFVSDNTKSRWGRRRPYILVGAITVGVCFALMWQLPAGHSEMFYFWVFLGSSIAFYSFYTVFAAPWVALGYELTPDYHERTRVMAVMNFMGQFAWVSLPWSYAIMSNERFFPDPVQGARTLALILGGVVVVCGVLPAIFCRERLEPAVAGAAEGPRGMAAVRAHVAEFAAGIAITVRRAEFLKLCGGTFFLFNAIMLIGAFSSYIVIFYVCGGDNALGGRYIGLFGTISTLSTLGAIALVTALSKRLGKRTTFLIATSCTLAGSVLKWFCYDPLAPWKVLLPAPLVAVGMGALFTLMGSMMADVCDLDALECGKRREGTFGAVYWWIVKLGMALAFAASGVLLNATGFDVEWGGAQTDKTFFWMRVLDVAVPSIGSALAMAVMWTYPITEERSLQIRQETERRRATATATASAAAAAASPARAS